VIQIDALFSASHFTWIFTCSDCLPVVAGTTSWSTWWRSCSAGSCSRCCGGRCRAGTVVSRVSTVSMDSRRPCSSPSRLSTRLATVRELSLTAAPVQLRCSCFSRFSAPSPSASLQASSLLRYHLHASLAGFANCWKKRFFHGKPSWQKQFLPAYAFCRLKWLFFILVTIVTCALWQFRTWNCECWN